MVIITKRQKDIIEFLLSNSCYVTVEKVANKFNVSMRTVRNDLVPIAEFLNANNCFLESKTNNGIRIIADDIGRLQENLKNNFNKFLDYRDREVYILLRCLISKDITYNLLAQEIGVSKQTVINQFCSVEDILESNEITVDKKPGKGIEICGNECNVRNCFRSILYSDRVNDLILKKLSSISEIADNYNIAKEIMNKLCEEMEIKFPQQDRTLIMFSFVIYRSKIGFHCDNKKHLLKFSNSAVYRFLNDIKGLEMLNENDLLYLTGSIISNGMFDLSQNNSATENDINDAEEITVYLLKKLQQIQSIDMHNKKSFVDGLTKHLSSAIYRLRNGIIVNNELIEQIKYRIPLMYEFTKKQLLECENNFNLEFNENEIAYIAMYLTSAYEDSLRDEFNFKILLVCSFGVTTSAILKSRITQSIPEYNIVGPLNIKEAKEYLKDNKVDLIVSTIDFQYDDIKTIVVGALLSIEDISSIKERLVQISYDNMCSKFLNSYKETQEHNRLYISDTVDKDKVKIVDSLSTWQQAIKLAAKPLVDDGSLQPRYVDAMIKAVIEYGLYMVLVPEIAFVHAGIEDGINRECSSILILKKPILFGEKNPKSVRAVVVMGVKDKKSTSLLNNVYILEDLNNRQLLKKEDLTVEEVLNMHV